MSKPATWGMALVVVGVCAAACAGDMDAIDGREAGGGPAGGSDDVDTSGDAADAAAQADGRAGATPSPRAPVHEVDVATEANALDAAPGCLTFFTPEQSAGSTFEGGLAAASSLPRLVFLNRRGGTYSPGTNNSSTNTSSIPSSTVQVAPYEGTDADWSAILSCVRDEFSPFNVQITDQDPGTTAHVEAVVGDGPGALGLPSGVGGISPFNCGVLERSIVYVFSKVLFNTRTECEVIAHEVGHSFGLEHEYLCQDPMTYLNGCGQKTFQDVAAQCGTDSPVACECGSPTQNTVDKLLTNVGPAGMTPPPPTPTPTDAPPSVAVLAPQNGASLPGNTNLTVTVQASDDKGVSDVRLLWEFNGTRTMSCKSPQAGTTCSINGDRYTFTLAVGTGARAFTAEAVDSAGQTTRSSRVQITLTSTSVDAPPSVALNAPVAGTVVSRGARISVRATATDDKSVREVSLRWQLGTSTSTFRMSNLGNNVFGVDLQLSSTATRGARTLTAVATDDAGQATLSAPVTIQVR